MSEKTDITPMKAEASRQLFRSPFGFVENVLNEVENLWQRPFRPMVRRFDKAAAPWVPTFDAYEKDGALVVKADLPGLKKEDVHIFMEDGALVLQGERKEEKAVDKESFYLTECSYGSFYRRLPLSFAVDLAKVTAQLTDGVLEVRVPLPAVEAPKPREIPVN